MLQRLALIPGNPPGTGTPSWLRGWAPAYAWPAAETKLHWACLSLSAAQTRPSPGQAVPPFPPPQGPRGPLSGCHPPAGAWQHLPSLAEASPRLRRCQGQCWSQSFARGWGGRRWWVWWGSTRGVQGLEVWAMLAASRCAVPVVT